MLEARNNGDLVSPSAWSAAPKIFSYPQAGPADYPIFRGCSGHAVLGWACLQMERVHHAYWRCGLPGRRPHGTQSGHQSPPL